MMKDIENVSFSLLGPGLGFYEKKPEKAYKEKAYKNLSDFRELQDLALPKDFDLESAGAYEHLVSLLEKPIVEKSYIEKPIVEKSYIEKPNPAVSAPAVSTQVSAPAVSAPAPPATLSAPVVSAQAQQTQTQTQAQQTQAPLLSNPFSLKAYLTDAFLVSILFFPPLLFFAFLTDSLPFKTLKALWPSVLISFFLFAEVYCFLCRLFCFETFGEALAKIRLSRNKDQSNKTLENKTKSDLHPFRLFWRFLLSCLTGIIFIPLLSLIFRKDIMARLSGLYFKKSFEES